MAIFIDPMLKIEWPIEPTVVSEKDCEWGLLEHRMNEIDVGFATTK